MAGKVDGFEYSNEGNEETLLTADLTLPFMVCRVAGASEGEHRQIENALAVPWKDGWKSRVLDKGDSCAPAQVAGCSRRSEG